ncbi:MAG TPA: TonB-dependent receptor [Candidatus Desulfaltia sp.]|nr:TonB-dependent receptor [Candidatus Desulfaltia sp.]
MQHRNRGFSITQTKMSALILGLIISLSFSFPGWSQEKTKEKEVDKKAQETKITEEIIVVGRAPRDLPVATVTTIMVTQIDQRRPLDLAEAIRYAPGVMVTFGDKDTYTLKLRGMDAKRIALLLDGVPEVEPYYSTFDLKTVTAAGLDSLQITKGPSSVLYGPNTLGGIVNVITRRPGPEPRLALTGSYGEHSTRGIILDGGAQWKKFALAGSASYQDSNRFVYPDESGENVSRANSDYERFNLNAKLYYTPSDRTEIMVNGGIYRSNYGMPAALSVQRARYWRFKNWDRTSFNAGGFTSLGERSTLRFRAFYIGYQNTLNQWRDAAMTVRQFESTFDNEVYGAFGLADLAAGDGNALKLSLYFQKDIARSQDDVGLSWDEFDQSTMAAGLEDHYDLGDRWKLIGGLSLDYIAKYSGGSTTKLNPLIGIKFSPAEYLDLHASASLKSKFPSMRSMYSTTSGNPDLVSEQGTCFELGGSYNRGILVSGAIFAYEFKNLIDSVRLADGSRRYWNIGRAHINGAELQVQKDWRRVSLLANYTYLDNRNESDDRPLDALSDHSLNFDVTLRPVDRLRLTALGLYGSKSHWFDSTTSEVLEIPAYFSLDAVAAYDLRFCEVFVKATNIFNAEVYTEPGFPWRGSYFEVGVRLPIL